MSMDNPSSPAVRHNAKAFEKRQAEIAAELDRLAARSDYRPELDYFLDVFRNGPSLSAVAQRVNRPVVAIFCAQVPLELFHAFGFHPYKVFSGSSAAGQTASQRLPPLACPMLRSALGGLGLDALKTGAEPGCQWVIPTTCDWVVKFSEMARLCGDIPLQSVHWLELPRLKDSPRAQDRWFSEVAALSNFLGRTSCRELNRKTLLQSIATFQEARQSFGQLLALRRAGCVSAPWFFLITSSFFLDRVENWTAALDKALPRFQQTKNEGKRIFLAGSPIFFPNFKLLHLLEDVGLLVVGDDLCSSERIFPLNVAVGDPSREGLLRALAESYHQGCLCPTFGDNERRINNIWEARQGAGFGGVVFHVLKGCHPYDLESLSIEEPLKNEGLRFLRVETDYSFEDSQNMLTRLEAFGRTLGD